MPRRQTSRRSPSAAPRSAPPPPFSRPITLGASSHRRAMPFDIAATPEELPEIARFLGLDTLRSLRFRGELAPAGDDEWRASGRLEAEAVQSCVVTLAPVESRIDEQVTRSYLPADAVARLTATELDLDPEAEDDPDPYDGSIDPGALAIESLALALDPYPRAPGVPPAEFSASPPGAEPLSDAGPKPFAGLAELKRRLDRDG